MNDELRERRNWFESYFASTNAMVRCSRPKGEGLEENKIEARCNFTLVEICGPAKDYNSAALGNRTLGAPMSRGFLRDVGILILNRLRARHDFRRVGSNHDLCLWLRCNFRPAGRWTLIFRATFSK
jgi:hypothetical protein